ncbi:hypothetical protein HWV62_1653 [Athelia sp. TMB]|nr:hypothetical protein HWV62_1653 [Athelia sp. TMB]
MIPRSESQDPIELKNIRPEDFEILLDYLSTGMRYDKQPLNVVDWASVIAVGSRYRMQRILDHACNALLDQHNTATNIRTAGAGFERDTYGMYFLIREKGTANYLGDYWYRSKEGVQLQLWPRQNESNEVKMSQVFFIDRAGALHHAVTGLAVDIIDNVPILRRNRPVSSSPNPWSHPLPEFSFVNSQIRVKFLSDPSLPSCTDDMYPKGSWATGDFVLAARPEKDFHMHPISDFSPWIPAAVIGRLPYETGANHDKKWRVLVEERKEDAGGKRTSWEIVPTSKG